MNTLCIFKTKKSLPKKNDFQNSDGPQHILGLLGPFGQAILNFYCRSIANIFFQMFPCRSPKWLENCIMEHYCAFREVAWEACDFSDKDQSLWIWVLILSCNVTDFCLSVNYWQLLIFWMLSNYIHQDTINH